MQKVMFYSAQIRLTSIPLNSTYKIRSKTVKWNQDMQLSLVNSKINTLSSFNTFKLISLPSLQNIDTWGVCDVVTDG